MKMRLQQAFFNSSQATQRISKRNSTGNASWGGGPNTEADEKSAYNNVQVGANIEKLDSQFLQTMQVGVGQR